MANNRLWLVHTASGRRVMLCKRGGWGWYTPPATGDNELEARMDVFLGGSEDDSDSYEEMDGFHLEIEDNTAVPHIKEGYG